MSDVALRFGAAARPQSVRHPDDLLLIPAIAADGTLYPVGKMEAHRLGLLHLAVSVFVFCEDELLIQRRAAGKYHCGSLWANTCCTHPNWAESQPEAAQRRVREELGFSVALTSARSITYRTNVGQDLLEHERVRVFWGTAEKTQLRLVLNSAEVHETRWATVRSLRAEASAHPWDFAPWFRIYLARWAELGL